MQTEDRLLAILYGVVGETFPDRDFDFLGTPEPATRLFADLGFASIDLIVLAERLDARFGRRLPFGAFLKELRDRGADDIELGELVAFLQQHIG